MTTAKGQRRRQAIITAAAELALAEGPAAVTHRRVAHAAAVPLAATTYYFADRDELLNAAGTSIAESWALRAEQVADSSRPDTNWIDAVIQALLPRRIADIRGHYEHLVGSGRDRSLAAAYRSGRARLDEAVRQILNARNIQLSAELVIAVADGAVVSALSEGRPVRAHVRRLLRNLLGD